MLSPDDLLAIQNLNSRHFHSLDAQNRVLTGNPAETWADTFHSNGSFQTQTSDGTIIFEATGREELIKAHQSFPDISTTRHWICNLLIEPDPRGARSSSYIIAMALIQLQSSGQVFMMILLHPRAEYGYTKRYNCGAFSPKAE